LIAKSPRWQLTALAAAALFAMFEPNAMALSLGRVTVQSALGEPLRAEVEVPDINAEEAASLKTVIGSPAAFKAAGLDYSAAMSGLQATLRKRADGRTYIRLNGDRAINDPFVDIILEASWASGRIVRDYTLLFDPPSLRQPAPAAPNPAQVAAPQAASPSAAAVRPSSPTPSTPRAAERIGSAPQTPIRTPAAAPGGSASGKVSVRQGDTASKIAAATKPASVSLDQMLVALLRANPAAFMGDNVNRIKAGSVMTIPSAEQAAATPEAEAMKVIVAQSRDFNEFRRKLAERAPGAPVATAEARASGSIQAKVDDKRMAAIAPDKLTLSKGAIQKQQEEDQLARDRAAREAANRAAELSKNISDLSKLGVASNAGAPGSMAGASAPAQGAAANVTAAASAPALAGAPAARRPTAVPAPAVKQSAIDELLENPLLPGGAVAVAALLAILGFYRARQRKLAAQDDALSPDINMRPDAFFAASGGQRIDTSEPATDGSAIPYSPSQLGPSDEVDPVAEADVYLAYGRDEQAEEILRVALRATPERLAIHQKLLELFAKRRDLKSFQAIAELAFDASQGQGPDWERIRELGHSIDDGNPLYEAGGQPKQPDEMPTDPAPLGRMTTPASGSAKPAVEAPLAPATPSVDIDLDLDFSGNETSPGVGSETSNSQADTTPAVLDLDLGLPTVEGPALATADASTNAIEFSLPESAAVPDEEHKPIAAPAASPKFDMLEFDLGALSLDLDDAPPAPDSTPATDAEQDPLGTKLALAEEFQAIGDADGARALIEEVIAQASGDMKIKAQRALSKLSSA
jgi:pilus assembly protein FimV